MLNESVVAVDTGFNIPPIENVKVPPAVKLDDGNPFETVITLPLIDHVMPELYPATDKHDAAEVAVFEKLI